MDISWQRLLSLRRSIFDRNEMKAMAAWKEGNQSKKAIWEMMGMNVKYTRCIVNVFKPLEPF